ncbi:MAG: transposase [Chlorobi bacterium]|nr:transposase [Chlorobiota bacterium]
MRKSRFTPNQILRILKEYSEGKSSEEIVREYKISKKTLYNWPKRYGGMEASELKRLKALEEENRKLDVCRAGLRSPDG